MVQRVKAAGLSGLWYLGDRRKPQALQAEQLGDHRNRSRAQTCAGKRPAPSPARVPPWQHWTQSGQRSPGVMWSARPPPFQLKVTPPCPSPQGKGCSA